LISDRGLAFLNELVKVICFYFNIDKASTTAYHPQTDGLTERFNKTLAEMISSYVGEEQEHWDQIIPYVLFAYNTSVHASTHEMPFYLIYGRDARYPIDVSRYSASVEDLPIEDYRVQLKERVEIA